MLKLAGYADRLSVRPGETIHFHVAHNARDGGGGTVSARLVRVISADPNPAGPGIQVEPVASAGLVEEAAPAAERVPRGSYAVIEGGGHFAACRDLTVIVDLHRHVPETVVQTIRIGRKDASQKEGGTK